MRKPTDKIKSLVDETVGIAGCGITYYDSIRFGILEEHLTVYFVIIFATIR